MDEKGLFFQNFRQEVVSRATSNVDGALYEDAFTEIVIETFQEAGHFEDAVPCNHRSTGSRGAILQMSGYGVSDNGEHLDLFITLYSGQLPPEHVTTTEAKKHFDRLIRIFNFGIESGYSQLEESSPAFDALQSIWRICKLEKTILTVRMVLITDGVMTGSIPKDVDKNNIRLNFDVLDIERIYRYRTSGIDREKIEFDFLESTGKLIPCLVQPDSNPDYSSYLAIFPGRAIAEIYGRFGSRLLERNVRSFLQARGKINRGIRDTIINDPQMFLAFNNGLSITAETVETEPMTSGGIGIRFVRDLQIVNGGQTTASIFHAYKKDKNANIDRIYVQAKITVLSDLSKMDEIIPLISRYANSQNIIQSSDLVANDKYHRDIESLSRTIWAPPKDGTIRQQRWYYERARGQYADETARLQSAMQINAFLDGHPKENVFTKTDLSQALLTWDMMPSIVSRGAQKCLVTFMSHLSNHIDSEGQQNQLYFERLIAKLILFRSTRRLLDRNKSEFPAYRANIVTYCISRLVYETTSSLDLDKIWKEQSVSLALEKAILDLAVTTRAFLLHNADGQNVTEFCKRESTWKTFLVHDVFTQGGFKQFCSLQSRQAKLSATANATHAFGLRKQKVMSTTALVMFDLIDWGRNMKKLNALQCSILTEISTKVGLNTDLSNKEIDDAYNIIETAERLGFSQK